MRVEIKVPQLAESVSEATLLGWQKQPGDTINRGDNLVDIETDKVVLEVAAPQAGVLTEIIKHDGESVGSDEVIAIIDTAKSTQTSPPPVQASLVPDAAPTLSPAVRKLITEHTLDPARITGTGKGGRLTKADVLKHLEAASPPPVPKPETPATIALIPSAKSSDGRPEETVPMTRLRRHVAQRLLAAQHDNAILTTFNEVNMQPVMDMRARYRDQFAEEHGVKLGFMSFFTKACVEALKKFPEINASVEGENIVYHGYFDMGIAISSPRGLVVPILRDADQMSYAEIEQAIRDMGTRAHANKLTMDDLTGGTFTITNGGIFGSLLSTPILNPPQSAILGMHKIQERPVAEHGEVVIRPMMNLALSYDHRIIDGREAVQFLVTVKEQLEDPARMLLQV